MNDRFGTRALPSLNGLFNRRTMLGVAKAGAASASFGNAQVVNTTD